MSRPLPSRVPGPRLSPEFQRPGPLSAWWTKAAPPANARGPCARPVPSHRSSSGLRPPIPKALESASMLLCTPMLNHQDVSRLHLQNESSRFLAPLCPPSWSKALWLSPGLLQPPRARLCSPSQLLSTQQPGGSQENSSQLPAPPFKAPPPQSLLTSHWPRATAQRGTSRVWPRPSLCSPVTSPGPLVNLSCSLRVTPTPRSPRAPGPPRGGFCNPVTRRGLHRVLPLCVAFTVCCASLPVGG